MHTETQGKKHLEAECRAQDLDSRVLYSKDLIPVEGSSDACLQDFEFLPSGVGGRAQRISGQMPPPGTTGHMPKAPCSVAQCLHYQRPGGVSGYCILPGHLTLRDFLKGI